MLRNYLITNLSQHDNDTVTVSVNGILIDVDSVTSDRGGIVLILDPRAEQSVLRQVAENGNGETADVAR
ncbi:MAG: hypothetical protein QOH97_4700 [Actinoplanes sp.]|jgi:hypothetical protein|nr:hypothetical protein [Actinoplanes sp.]